MTEQIYVLDNGVKRLANTKELAQLEADRLTHQQDLTILEAQIAKRKAAEAKLTALGLTSDDLKALGLSLEIAP